MYICVKTKVFCNGFMADSFYSSLGVCPGECLSPFLLCHTSMILKNVLMCLGREWRLNIWNYWLYCMQMMLLFSQDHSSLLHAEIDIVLFKYCEQLKLMLNTSQSKILIFRKGNRLATEEWKFEEHALYSNKKHCLSVVWNHPINATIWPHSWWKVTGNRCQCQYNAPGVSSKHLATLWQSFMVDHYICPVPLSIRSREWCFPQLP